MCTARQKCLKMPPEDQNVTLGGRSFHSWCQKPPCWKMKLDGRRDLHSSISLGDRSST